nr:NADH dehydrogenase subunit 2 [Zygocanna sp. MKL-2023]
MKFDLLNLFIFMIILITILEYKNNKQNIFYMILSLCIIFFALNSNNYFNVFMFDLNFWKYLFIFLIFGLYIIIIDLIEEKTFDIYCLCTLVFLGSMLLVLCDNLITLYLGLELQTFSIFVLIAKNRVSIKSSEAGLKYFILGAISSGFYLLGITIMFLSGFSLELKDIIILSYEYTNVIGLIFISLSFCFKLSLFPLHFWIPDIYEGSSWDIISLISTLPKISVLSILIQILINSNMLLTFSLLSIIVGSLGALNQSKIKRLLGYSGISHIGFILLGYNILNKEGYIISDLYLFIYMMIMISIFILIISSNVNSKYIIELGSLKFINKIFSITFIVLILSMAGIPPLSGFISKWFLLWASIEYHYNLAAFIMILFSAISAGYYLRIVKIIYFQQKSSYFLWEQILKASNVKNELNLLLLGFLFYISLFFILNFSFIIDFINISIINFF